MLSIHFSILCGIIFTTTLWSIKFISPLNNYIFNIKLSNWNPITSMQDVLLLTDLISKGLISWNGWQKLLLALTKYNLFLKQLMMCTLYRWAFIPCQFVLRGQKSKNDIFIEEIKKQNASNSSFQWAKFQSVFTNTIVLSHDIFLMFYWKTDNFMKNININIHTFIPYI